MVPVSVIKWNFSIIGRRGSIKNTADEINGAAECTLAWTRLSCSTRGYKSYNFVARLMGRLFRHLRQTLQVPTVKVLVLAFNRQQLLTIRTRARAKVH